MTAFEILVVYLSISLAIFLLISILLVWQIIKLVKQLQRVSEKAEAVVADVEQVGDFFRKTTGKLALGKLIGLIVDNVTNHKRKGNR